MRNKAIKKSSYSLSNILLRNFHSISSPHFSDYELLINLAANELDAVKVSITWVKLGVWEEEGWRDGTWKSNKVTHKTASQRDNQQRLGVVGGGGVKRGRG